MGEVKIVGRPARVILKDHQKIFRVQKDRVYYRSVIVPEDGGKIIVDIPVYLQYGSPIIVLYRKIGIHMFPIISMGTGSQRVAISSEGLVGIYRYAFEESDE